MIITVPSRPRNVTIKVTLPTSAVVQWLPPLSLNGPNVTYMVACTPIVQVLLETYHRAFIL